MNKNFTKVLSVLMLIAVGWYIVLCTKHFFNQRELWNDEYVVSLSVIKFSAYQMFHDVLIADQVFPRVYLYLIQRVAEPSQFIVLGLRFLPFVAMISAFFVWMRNYRRETDDPILNLTLILTWCASLPLVYYAAELKQYSMDVLVAGLFVGFLSQQPRLKSSDYTQRQIIALVLLPLLVFVSFMAYLFVWIVLYNFILLYQKDKGIGRWAILYGSVLAVCVLINYKFDLSLTNYKLKLSGGTGGFGDYFISFASGAEFWRSFGEGVMNLYSRWLVENPRYLKKIAVFFFVFGILNLFYSFFKNIRKEKFILASINTIAFVLFVQLFILGCLKKYPFTVPRTSLFFCPIAIYLTVMGIKELRAVNKYLYGTIHVAFVVFLIFLSIGLGGVIFAGDLGAESRVW